MSNRPPRTSPARLPGLAATVLVTAGLLASPAGAAPAGTWDAVLPPSALADTDGDRISDDLEHVVAAADSGDPVDVIVRLAPGTDAAAAQERAGSFAIRRDLPSIRAVAATMTAAQIRLLAAADDVVARVELDTVVRLTDEGARRDFGAARAQLDLTATGAGVGICIIDSGVDASHEQLDGGKVAGWIDLVSGLPDPYDDHQGGHGTHVAAVAAGDGRGGPVADRYRGVAPDASLYVAKAFAGAVIDDIPVVSPGTSQASLVVAAIEWCSGQPDVDVISMSFTATGPADGTDALSAAVEAAVSAGKVAVAAAGNDGPNAGFLGSPGAAASAITVGAAAEWSLPLTAPHRSAGPFLAAFSSRGPTLDGRVKPDVVGPGHSIRAAAANTGAGYVDKDGTSMSTPYVAGAVALAVAANPALTPSDVAVLVEATAQDRGAPGKDVDWGAGLIDVYGLVASTGGISLYEPTPFPTRRAVTGTASPGNPFSLTFDLGLDDLAIPIAVTIIAGGGPDPATGGVFWAPDLAAELHDPNGLPLDRSDCPYRSDPTDCLGNLPNAGRQELLHALPTVAGTYTVTISVSGATGGSFVTELSHGPVATGLPGACTAVFTAAGDGTSWHDPLNWSAPMAPQPDDVACVPAGQAAAHTLPSAGIAGLVVDGELAVGAGSTLSVSGAPLRVNGLLVVGAGSTLTGASPLDLRGTLTGDGTVRAAVTNRGDMVPGSPTGGLTVDGDYDQGLAGTLTVDVAGLPDDHDRLIVTGDAALDGLLRVITGPGFNGSQGDTAIVLDVAGLRSGRFGEAQAPDHPWRVDYAVAAPGVAIVLDDGDEPASGGRVAICHKPGSLAEKTLHLPPDAAAAHQRSHGDAAGPCP